MNIFDIFIAYVSWDDDGKYRPVLVVDQQSETMLVFNITTQYNNKSELVRKKYYQIIDWQQAGLTQPSYVDTNILRALPKAAWVNKKAFGNLTETDVQKLLDFLAQ
jgi:hypothetical protein